MHDDIPSEPVKYEINPIPIITALSLSLWFLIELVVKIALRAM